MIKERIRNVAVSEIRSDKNNIKKQTNDNSIIRPAHAKINNFKEEQI